MTYQHLERNQMTNDGLAKTAKATTLAPTMYQEIEQEENVARGNVAITQIIAYDATKKPRRQLPEKDGTLGEIKKDRDGNTLYEEIGRAPYFCQEVEDAMVFKENNPDARLETFNIQLRKRTAIKYIDSPRNMKAFSKGDK